MPILGATTKAVNICTIINHNKGCRADLLWKWIQKVQMEYHGRKSCAFTFAKAASHLY